MLNSKDNNDINMEKFECTSCSQGFLVDTRIETANDGKLCATCITDSYFSCVECHSYYNNDNKRECKEESYCEECFTDNCTICEDCEETVLNEDSQYIDDKSLCNACVESHYFACYSCGTLSHNDNIHTPEDNSRHKYCAECFSQECNYCTGCDQYFEASTSEGSDGEYYCTNCLPDNDDRETYNYSRKDNIECLETTKTNGIMLKYGVEIECFRPEDETEAKSTFFDNVDDGSLDADSGYIGEERRSGILQGDKGIDAINSFCESLNNIGYKVNKTSGLHCHIDLRLLSIREIANVMSFCKMFDKVIFSLMPKSRRNNTYCRYLDMAKSEYLTMRSLESERFNQRYSGLDRYKGTNLSSYFRHKTLEFRYHSGTTDGNKITQWVTLCLSIVELGKTRFWAKTKFINTTSPSLTNLKRMLSLLEMTQEQKEYWIARYKKFNGMPVILTTEESERD